MLIGGYDQYKDINCQRFCLQSKKWKNIENIKFLYYGAQALLTKDERYVILTTKTKSTRSNYTYDYIYIIEIIDKDTYTLRNSKLTAPTIKDFDLCPSR